MIASINKCARPDCTKPARGMLPFCDDDVVEMYFVTERDRTLDLIGGHVREGVTVNSRSTGVDFAHFMDNLIADMREAIRRDPTR